MYWLWTQIEHSYDLTATLCSSLTCCLIALCIVGYQRYLSPYKGFRCAHRALHQGYSCSEFTKRAVLEYGFLPAVPLVRSRFDACALASVELKREREPQRKAASESNSGSCGDGCVDGCADIGLDLACDAPDLLSGADCSNLQACGPHDACSITDACSCHDACACSWP